MSARGFDRLMSKSPPLAAYAESRMDAFFSTNTLVNACCCIAASFAAGLLSLCGNETIYIAALAVMAVVWLQSAVLSGFRKQWFFIFFTVIFWLLPYIFTDASESVTRTEGMDGIYSFLILASRIPTEFSVKALTPFFGGSFTLSLIIVGVMTVFVFIGSFIRSKSRRSDFYCNSKFLSWIYK